MCDDTPIDATDPLTWDPIALMTLRRELSSSPKEFEHLLDEEEHHPAFDPIKVRNLLRQVHAQNRDPVALLLGKIQMASFHHFMTRGFGEESGAHLREFFFLGIPVIEDKSLSRLEYVDIYEGMGQDDPHGHQAA